MALMRGLLILLAGVIAVPAFAKPTRAPAAQVAPNVTPIVSDEQYQKWLDAAKKSRKVASETDTFDYSRAYSDDAKNIQARINGGPTWANGKETATRSAGITSPAGITALINDLEKNYESLPQDAQFVAAFWITLKPWRGFIHRARPLVERHNLSQSAIVTFLRASFAGLNVFSPDTPSWKAGFDYLTLPGADLGAKINTEEDLYNFVGTQVLPALDTFNQRIAKLNFEKGIYFDNKVVVRNANFVDTRDRHVRLGEAERLAVLSGGLFAYSNLAGGMAYSWKGFFEAADHVGKVYGFSSALNDGSMTASKRFAAIKSHTTLFVLREGGAAWTSGAAWYRFKDGLRTARASWTWLKNNGNNNEATRNIFDPRAFIPFTRIIDTSFDNIEHIWGDKGIASAVINGETVDINFQKLFKKPPADLKAFFPITFVGGKNVETDPVTKESYRNYNFGNPEGWNVKVYEPYFPNVKTQADIKRTARVLNQAWGGWMLGIPLAGMTM